MSDGLDWMGWDGISPDRSISRSPSGDKNFKAPLISVINEKTLICLSGAAKSMRVQPLRY